MRKKLKLPKKLTDVYGQIKQRCYNPKCKEYKNYGERGIKVCDEWLKSRPSAFYQWAFENGYKEGLTVDRINNDGNYEPSNCHWTTIKAQCSNRRTNRFVTYNGKTLTVSQWSERTGINKETLKHRLNRGLPTEEVLTNPPRQQDVFIEYKGETKNLAQWSSCFGINRVTLMHRMRRQGMSFEEAVTTPITVNIRNRNYKLLFANSRISMALKKMYKDGDITLKND